MGGYDGPLVVCKSQALIQEFGRGPDMKQLMEYNMVHTMFSILLSHGEITTSLPISKVIKNNT